MTIFPSEFAAVKEHLKDLGAEPIYTAHTTALLEKFPRGIPPDEAVRTLATMYGEAIRLTGAKRETVQASTDSLFAVSK